MSTQNEEAIGIVLLIVVVAIFFLGKNFLGNIKAAPITLVPTGTQAAVNPTGQAALNAVVQGTAAGAVTNNVLAAQAAANNAQAVNAANQANAFGAIGAGLGNLINGITGNNDGSNGDSSGYN